MRQNHMSWVRRRLLYVIPVASLALSAIAASEFTNARQVASASVNNPSEPATSAIVDTTADTRAGHEYFLAINAANQLLFRTNKDAKLEYVQPVQVMDAIRQVKGDCTLTIHYDESSSSAVKTMEAFSQAGKSAGKFKIKVVKRRFPYTDPNVKDEGTVRINADGVIRFYNKTDDFGAFCDYATLRTRFNEVKTPGYVLNIDPDREAPAQVVNQIKDIARDCGMQKLNMVKH